MYVDENDRCVYKSIATYSDIPDYMMFTNLSILIPDLKVVKMLLVLMSKALKLKWERADVDIEVAPYIYIIIDDLQNGS